MKHEKEYDVVIVGTGLSGAVIAHELKNKGFKILMIERRNHIGGNCYTEDTYNNGIQVQKYGAHIFRTNKKHIWDYVSQFTEIVPFKHKVVVNYNEEVYSFPINLMTLRQVFGEKFTPHMAKEFFENITSDYDIQNPEYIDNLENHCKRMIGDELYEKFIKGYTEKQWGRPCTEITSAIIKRIPVRMNYNDTYFDASKIYEGIPKNGYTEIFDNMLKGITVLKNIDFNEDPGYWATKAKHIVYTGPIDELYGITDLEWRSLKFDTKLKTNCNDYQGVPVMNYTSVDVPYTRVLEHQHFYPLFKNTKKETVITFEYPSDYKSGMDKYYPIQTTNSSVIVEDLRMRAFDDNITLVGRLAEYKYYDMDDAIENALTHIDAIIKKIQS